MVDKGEKTSETPGDMIAQCRKYMEDFAELFKLLPDQVAAIEPDDKKPQKRKNQKVSLIQMEANIVKQREMLAQKRKTDKEEQQKNEKESTEESKEIVPEDSVPTTNTKGKAADTAEKKAKKKGKHGKQKKHNKGGEEPMETESREEQQAS